MKNILVSILLSVFLTSPSFARVQNEVLFIGEVVSGGTNGAPLSQSATGKVASGITANLVKDTADTTTTSTTDAVIATMTTTPVSGFYDVKFCTTLAENTNNANVFVSIYSGGAQISGTEMSGTPQIQGGVTPSLNMRVPICTIAQATVNGSQAIEARWRVSAGTATSHTRIMTIFRLQ